MIKEIEKRLVVFRNEGVGGDEGIQCGFKRDVIVLYFDSSDVNILVLQCIIRLVNFLRCCD